MLKFLDGGCARGKKTVQAPIGGSTARAPPKPGNGSSTHEVSSGKRDMTHGVKKPKKEYSKYQRPYSEGIEKMDRPKKHILQNKENEITEQTEREKMEGPP